jgi:hypothetical protein
MIKINEFYESQYIFQVEICERREKMKFQQHYCPRKTVIVTASQLILSETVSIKSTREKRKRFQMQNPLKI